MVTRLAGQPEIESATGVRVGVFKLDGAAQQLFGVDASRYDQTVRTDTAGGQPHRPVLGRGRDPGGRRPSSTAGRWVRRSRWSSRSAARQSEPIRAIYKDNQINGPYLLALADYERHYADQLDVIASSGRSRASRRTPRARRSTGWSPTSPASRCKDQAQYKQDQANQINQVLVLFYLLLALAVVIAFIGIINTLALSVLERIRELGLLRALGMTRGQVRAMIRWEAIIIAVLGAVLGLVVGVFFGWVIVRALHSQGITDFSLPLGTLLEFVVVAAIAGILAAVFPGRRAARIDVLEAIATE